MNTKRDPQEALEARFEALVADEMLALDLDPSNELHRFVYYRARLAELASGLRPMRAPRH
jgi:hypothetical protein